MELDTLLVYIYDKRFLHYPSIIIIPSITDIWKEKVLKVVGLNPTGVTCLYICDKQFQHYSSIDIIPSIIIIPSIAIITINS